MSRFIIIKASAAVRKRVVCELEEAGLIYLPLCETYSVDDAKRIIDALVKQAATP